MAWNPPQFPSYPSYPLNALPVGFPAGSAPPTVGIPPQAGVSWHPEYPTPPTNPNFNVNYLNESKYIGGPYGIPGVEQPPPYGTLYPTMNISSPVAQNFYSSSRGTVLGNVIEPARREISHGMLELKYSSSLDAYLRPTDHDRQYRGWRSLVYAEDGIERKEEYDWKKSYLARIPRVPSGFVEWRFDFGRTARRVRALRIKFPTKRYENASVFAFIRLETGETIRLAETDRFQEIDNRIRGSTRFSVVAELTRGLGEHGWQHAQLFRQDMNPGLFASDESIYAFQIRVEMD